MLSLRAAVGASAAALLLLAGCGGDPDPGDPSSTWTPTGTPESPTSAATQAPVEPKLPQAATKATEDGARAFIGYYWELINYVQVTGDVKELKRLSSTTCGGCQRAISAVETLYRDGGHAEGGQYQLKIDQIGEVKTASNSLYGVQAQIEVRNDEQLITRPDGATETSAPKSSRFNIYATWTGRVWRIDILEPR